jgi:diaminopimelate decarboxylase
VSGIEVERGARAFAGVPLERVLEALRRLEPGARACWAYDLDLIEARARRFAAAFAGVKPRVAYALKANALPAILERLREAGADAECGSLGELAIAEAAGFDAARRNLNGNGRTPEEAEWAARRGLHSVNADSPAELELLERAAAGASARLRVALRVNPGIATSGHAYVATGHEAAKFGMSPDEALAAWAGRARWPHLRVDGLHVHVGSQLLDLAPLEAALDAALELAAESERRGAALGLVNLGGGFGIDYEGRGAEFPVERWGARLAERARSTRLEWVLEPGRWIVAPAGVLLAEVLWVKERAAGAAGPGPRFVVLAAGMNDLLRPALYRARHRIVPLEPRPGERRRATVVGPVCESADVFAEELELAPLEPGDVVAILDAGAYGAAMSSNYNGRGRLAELVASGGTLTRARAGETAADLAGRRRADRLEI